MTHLQGIEEEIQQVENMKDLMETYESIAALYMRRVKQSVVTSRAFFGGLQAIYQEILTIYSSQVAPRRNKRITFRKRLREIITLQGKQEAAVLFSTDMGLYGSIVEKTFQPFLAYIRRHSVDPIIIGARGGVLLQELLPGITPIILHLSDSSFNPEQFTAVAERLSHYKKITLFYGKFESFINQAAAISVLGEDQPIATVPGINVSLAVKYLFEPSLTEVFHFFETEIFKSLLEQITHESYLAKLASRMFLLDTATVHAQNMLQRILLDRQKIIHQNINKHQLELMASRIALGI